MPSAFSQRVGARAGRNASRFLLQWEAADGLDDDGRLVARTGQVATFSRGGTVGAATLSDANGRLYSAANQQPRIHFVFDPTTGIYQPTLLLEGGRGSGAFGACSFGDATYWGSTAAFTITAASSRILGQTAHRHTDAAGGNSRSQTVGVFVNGQTDCAAFVLENDTTNPTTQSIIGIWDNTAGAWVHEIRLTWSTKSVATIVGSGMSGVMDLGTGPNGGAMVCIWVTATGTGAGTGAAGNMRQMYAYPAMQAGKASIIHNAQFEANSKFPSSAIITSGSALTRSADGCSFAFNTPPTATTWYVRFIERGTCLDSGMKGILGIGSSANAALMLYNSGANQYRVTHRRGADVHATAAATPALGDLVELRIVLGTDGSVALGQSINAAPEIVTAPSAANALAGSWNDSVLTIGCRDTGLTTVGFSAFAAVKVAYGAQDRGYMRAG